MHAKNVTSESHSQSAVQRQKTAISRHAADSAA